MGGRGWWQIAQVDPGRKPHADADKEVDAALIVESRNQLPGLLKYVRRLERERAQRVLLQQEREEALAERDRARAERDYYQEQRVRLLVRVLTEVEVEALLTALEAFAVTPPVVPDLDVYTAAVEKLRAALAEAKPPGLQKDEIR